MMNDVKSSRPMAGSLQELFGLLAMFGVDSKGTLPRYRAHVSKSNHAQPQAVQDYLIKRAAEKRARRTLKKANLINAS